MAATNYNILKLVFSATAVTKAKPTDYEYFYKASSGMTTSIARTIASTKFNGGTGTNVAYLIKPIQSNGYTMLFINGVKQESAVYSFNSTTFTLNVTSPTKTIPLSAPFTLVTVNFAPTTAITVND